MKKISCHFISGVLSSNSPEAFNFFKDKGFGERKDNKIIYSMYEALYLVEEGKIEIEDFKKRLIERDELIKKFTSIDRKFYSKYLVFKDLRKKGYIVKTALKFGGDFRVYERGKKVEKSHSRWIVLPLRESERIPLKELSAKNRVAHSTRKNLLLGIIDEEGDISYFELRWVKP